MKRQRGPQLVLIASTLVASWLGMQWVHEAGHVLGAWGTGGEVTRVVLHPLGISRTDVGINPRPLVVTWTGPLVGVLAPLVLWGVTRRGPAEGVSRFFAGFCLVANGLYLGLGTFDGVGDCGTLLAHGARHWQLWLFGSVTVPAGLALWHGLGTHFGLGEHPRPVSRSVAAGVCALAVTLAALGLLTGDR